jgi:lipoyl synthase
VPAMRELCGASLERMATRSRSNLGGIADVLTVLSRDVQPHKAAALVQGPCARWPGSSELHRLITAENLHTVRQEAACPNLGECWQRGTATFMILGDMCTRRRGFCNVKTGKPTWNDPLEPDHVARSVARMCLRRAVIGPVARAAGIGVVAG